MLPPVADPYPAQPSNSAHRQSARGARPIDKRGILQKLAEMLHPGPDSTDELIATLSEAELRHLMQREYARTGDDVVWRRSKLGLRLTADQIAAIDDWMKAAQHA